jgi:CHAT domain-containing protein/Flp pilus assembly protein TadD
MGDYAKAESLLKEALGIRQKVLGREHPDTAACLNNLAELYEAMSDYAKAEPLYKEALEIFQKVLGPEHPDTATALNNLAELYRLMGDYAKAEPLLKDALQIRQKVLGREHPDTAACLNNLAELYRATRDYAKAEALFKEVLEIRQKVLGPEHPLTAQSLNNLALFYWAMGDYAKAEPLLKEALETYQKVLGRERPSTAISLSNLAFLEFDLGRSKEAVTLARSASDAQHKLLSKMFSFSSEPQRLAYVATLNPYSLFALLPGCEADLALALLRYKGVVLDSIIEDRLLAQASTNAEDRDRVERLKADQRQLDRLLLQVPQKGPEASQIVEKLEQEVEELEGQPAQHVAGLGQARRALGVTLEQVQARLPADCALVEYVRYRRYLGKEKFEGAYGALVLLAQGGPRWIPLGKAAQVDKLITRYRTLADSGRSDDELAANLKGLYETVWGPLQSQLPGDTQRLIVSPDGQLNFVSLATLLTPQSQFLGEKFEIQYVASGRELLEEKPSTAEHDVVLFAPLDFGTSGAVQLVDGGERSMSPPATQWRGTEKRGLQGVRFDPLPGTRDESKLLLRLFESWHWSSQCYIGPEATKAALLRVRSPFILHLATHGFFEPQDPAQDRSDKPSVFQSKFFANPMHQSGLALSGANLTLKLWDQGQEAASADNNGILTAEEVSTMDLGGTWLVSLSACDTGSGQARAGEGVMGLRRGFVQAGAQNLLMTLWHISDEVTVQIMSDFYAAAHQSGDAPEALTEVQRAWLVKLRKEQGLQGKL